jgi:hypothetical protein
MEEVSPVAQELARRLLAHEAGARQRPEELAAAIERIHRRLCQTLAQLIGPAGFNALFARALHLAQATSPALVRVTADEQVAIGLQGAREFAIAHDSFTVQTGFVSILAHFIGLLIRFVGEELTVHLIREAWPGFRSGAVSGTNADAGG